METKQIIDLPETIRIDIRKLDLFQMEEWVLTQNLPKFRAKQIFEWLSQVHILLHHLKTV